MRRIWPAYSMMMKVTSGRTTASIRPAGTVIARGMPGGMQVKVGSLPWPPAAWSARLASSTFWYSGVRGACCPRPSGLLESHWTPTPAGRNHWPRNSGYFDSSNASAALAAVSAAASMTAPTRLRIVVLPAETQGIGRRTRRPMPVGSSNLDLHELRRRTIGRHPDRRALRSGVDFKIPHLVFRRRQVFRRAPRVHVDLVETAAREVVRPDDLVLVIGARRVGFAVRRRVRF